MDKFNYTYKIVNIDNGKMYIGSRTSKIHPKEDLGKVYFSSSLDKKFIKDQKINPNNYKYLILGIFKTREEADLYESKLHEEYNVDKNTMFYNRAKQTTAKFRYDPSGTKLSKKHRENISKSLIGRPVSEETRKKLREANLGKSLTDECKLKLSIAHTGKKHTEETKNKMSISRKGKKTGKLNPVWGRKWKRKTCPYCNKDVSINTFNRFHNDNCKERYNKI